MTTADPNVTHFPRPRASAAAAESLARLRRAADRVAPKHLRFMEVCGTHTVNAFRSGLHSLMPPNVTLLSGPGCPVCVTAQGEIDQLIDVANRPRVALCTYGDMLRVTGSGDRGSLELARARGADVRVVYSALDAVKLAAAEPNRQVVFAAVGFETTAPATAAAVLEADRRWLGNFTVLASHKLILPAMRALLGGMRGTSGFGERHGVDGFLCPGHVSVVIGAEAFRPIVDEYGLPCVVAGFEGPHIAAGLARLTELAAEGRAALENLYPQAVGGTGNPAALALMEKVFTAADACWRGMGHVFDSGLALRPEYRRYDARVRYELPPAEGRESRGCRCGDVITGKATPAECKLFGTACTPVQPLGPCMVSSEGTCGAWFKYHRLRQTPARRANRSTAAISTGSAT